MIVQVDEIYVKVYEALQENVDEVLRQHAIQQVKQRLIDAEQRIQTWEAKYGCDYQTFAKRVATDEVYLQQIESNFETQMWEGDLFEWEFDMETLKEWQGYLEQLLTTS